MIDDRDDAFGGIIAFVIAWCMFGLVGLIPWNYSGSDRWVWHMYREDAWGVWALFVSLAALAVGFITYAWKRWWA
jgi:hypothetical protein